MYSVGLIGCGAFGKLLVEQLSAVCSFEVYDPKNHPDDLRAALAQPIVVFALPAQQIERFITEHASRLRLDALYIDVCSVKVMPVAIMQKLLPASAEIIATHPLFGPATVKAGLTDQRIMAHPVRVRPAVYEEFKSFLHELRLEIIETTPDDHDRALAYVQGLSHFIGRTMQKMQIPDTRLATRAYQDLLDMKYVQGNDSDELFHAIVTLNPYTQAVLGEFADAQEQVRRTLDS